MDSKLITGPRGRTALLTVAALVAAAVGAFLLLGTDEETTATRRPAVSREVEPPSTSAAPPSASGSTSTTPSTPSSSTSTPTTPPAPASSTPPTTSVPADPAPAPSPEGARPVSLSVPSIDVDAPVILLGLNPDRSLEVPEGPSETGWWTGGAVPGSPGPSVIAGHVNLGGEAGVFADLGTLGAGDEVAVTLDDQSVVRYRVDRVERHLKDSFPTDAVYGPTNGPQLRLITCGGSFDEETGSYRDNVIAFASPVA